MIWKTLWLTIYTLDYDMYFDIFGFEICEPKTRHNVIYGSRSPNTSSEKTQDVEFVFLFPPTSFSVIPCIIIPLLIQIITL